MKKKIELTEEQKEFLNVFMVILGVLIVVLFFVFISVPVVKLMVMWRNLFFPGCCEGGG